MQPSSKSPSLERTVTPKLNDSFTPLVESDLYTSHKMFTENELQEIDQMLSINTKSNAQELDPVTENFATAEPLPIQRDNQVELGIKVNDQELLLSQKQTDELIAQLD